MIKKRYLIILSLTIASVLLGSLLYNNITLAQKGKEPTQVEVTNLPIDEHGNLKIATPPTFEAVNVTDNQAFTFTVGEDRILLGEANVAGWTKVAVYIYWSSKPSEPGFNGLSYRLFYRTPSVPSMVLSTPEHYQYESDGQAVCLVWEVHGPILGILAGSSGGIQGTTLTTYATVSLYCYN